MYLFPVCLLGLPRMVVIRDYNGIPYPQCGPPLSIHVGDVIELMFADLHSSWWQVRVTQLILVLPQHLWLYEKITCHGSLGWLRARNVSAVSSVWILAACHLCMSLSVLLLVPPFNWENGFLNTYERGGIDNLSSFFLSQYCACSLHPESCEP